MAIIGRGVLLLLLVMRRIHGLCSVRALKERSSVAALRGLGHLLVFGMRLRLTPVRDCVAAASDIVSVTAAAAVFTLCRAVCGLCCFGGGSGSDGRHSFMLAIA